MLAAKERISKTDSLFSLRKNIKLFFKRTHSDSIEQAYDNKWPDDIEIAYNLCFDNSNKALLLKEIPRIESEDFSIIYNYYFLDNGNTFAIKSQVSFFNEDCSSKAIDETRLNYYNSDSELYYTEYLLKDKNGTQLDSAKCNFGDLPNFSLYKKLTETPLYSLLR